MSDVKFTCPFCGESFAGSSEYIGMEADCPSCGLSFKLESSGSASAKRPNGLMCFLKMFRNCVTFSGRARRREFWWPVLFNMVGFIIACVADAMVFSEYDEAHGAIVGIYALISLLLMMSLHFRRLHDTNKSGWWWLILLLPVVNLACIVWLMTDGDKGENRFGPDPKNR